MNRRDFFRNSAVAAFGFMILPGAGRMWRAHARLFQVHYYKYGFRMYDPPELGSRSGYMEAWGVTMDLPDGDVLHFNINAAVHSEDYIKKALTQMASWRCGTGERPVMGFKYLGFNRLPDQVAEVVRHS